MFRHLILSSLGQRSYNRGIMTRHTLFLCTYFPIFNTFSPFKTNLNLSERRPNLTYSLRKEFWKYIKCINWCSLTDSNQTANIWGFFLVYKIHICSLIFSLSPSQDKLKSTRMKCLCNILIEI